MTFSFQSSLFLIFITSKLLCVDINIQTSSYEDADESSKLKYFQYDISYGAGEDDPVAEDFQMQSGFRCLEKEKRYAITLILENIAIVNPMFNLALDSGDYFQHSKYHNDIDCQMLCVTWGSWWPSRNNLKQNKEEKVQIYFNFLTKHTDQDKKQLFLFYFKYDSKVQGSPVIFDILVSEYQTDCQKYSPGTSMMIAELDCEDKDFFTKRLEDPNFSYESDQELKKSYINEFKLGGTSYSYKGEGRFQMYLPVDKSEEEDVMKAIKERSSVKSDSSGNRALVGWKNLQCRKSGFEFLRGKLPEQILI